MHHIHIIRTSAESPEDAKLQAESIIEEWATENNWFTVINVVDTKGNITDIGTMSRWNPRSLEDIQSIANEALTFKYTVPTTEQIESVLNGTTKDNMIYFLVHMYFQYLYRIKHKQSIDIFTEEVNDWCFDEVGLTSYSEDSNLSTYFVVIDIHT